MNTIGGRGDRPTTATIFQFPLGGRVGLGSAGVRGLRLDEQAAAQPAVAVDWRSWYHGEAVSAERPGDHH